MKSRFFLFLVLGGNWFLMDLICMSSGTHKIKKTRLWQIYVFVLQHFGTMPIGVFNMTLILIPKALFATFNEC